MRRRPKTSPAEDIVVIASKLPWWVALGLAVISYLALHAYVGQPTTVALAVPGQVSSYMMPAILKGLATAGQFILPILFGVAALLSWVQQRKQVASSKSVVPFRTGQHQANASIAPSCPLCASQMVMRGAKRGANAGKSFWGCSQYPRCKGTREAD